MLKFDEDPATFSSAELVAEARTGSREAFDIRVNRRRWSRFVYIDADTDRERRMPLLRARGD